MLCVCSSCVTTRHLLCQLRVCREGYMMLAQRRLTSADCGQRKDMMFVDETSASDDGNSEEDTGSKSDEMYSDGSGVKNWRSKLKPVDVGAITKTLLAMSMKVSSGILDTTSASDDGNSAKDTGSKSDEMYSDGSGVKNWRSKLKPVDVGAMTKTLLAISMKVPSSILAQQSLERQVKRVLTWKQVQTSDIHRGSASELHRKKMISQQNDGDGGKSMKREQQSFTAAMSDTEQSVRNYFDQPLSTSDERKPDAIVESTAVEKTDVVAGDKLTVTDPNQQTTTGKSKKRTMIAVGSIEKRTRELMNLLKISTTSVSQRIRLEDLCQHLIKYPDSRGVAVKLRVVRLLLGLTSSSDHAVQDEARQALALVGHVPPVRGRGVRILTIDGGGTRGLLVVELLRQLEKACGQRMHEIFDYICGVSTGALLSVMLGPYHVPIDEIEQIYREFSSEMFQRNRLMGTSKLFTAHAYYDTALWERILRLNLGEKTFIESAKDAECPKMAAVSAVMNLEKIQCHLFRNYNLPAGVQSHYMGEVRHKFWEAIRASSAAPGYYEECKLGGHLHQDGGVLTNNPTAIAIHECRLLWPNESIQCVVSLGTGRYESNSNLLPASYTSLKSKVVKIVQSATDTEAVHTVLHDLLPPSSYFRFNPYMSDDFQLDEVRTEKWDEMVRDTQMYCRKNQAKLEKAAQQLQLGRLPHQKMADWVKLNTI